MGLYKRGKIWWLTFTHSRQRVTTSTKQTDLRLAERWAASYRSAVQEDRFLPQAKDSSLGEILERYLEIHLRPKNQTTYVNSKYQVRQILARLPAATPVSRLRPLADQYRAQRMLQRIDDSRDRTISPATVNRELSILKSATRKAVEWGMVTSDPLAGLRLAKLSNARVRYLEDAEFKRLLEAAHTDIVSIILMARHTGMRQSEILNLEWRDIDLHRGWIQIRHSKNGEPRFVPLTTELIEILSGAAPERDREGLVFRRHGVRIGRDGWLREQFTKAVRRAGLIDFHFHDLRHCWASHAAMRGIDVQTIAAILGHKTLRMTQRYSHLSSGHLKASIELAAPARREHPATKVLHSPSSPISTPRLPDAPKTETPPFLAGFRFRKFVEATGFEPATSSLRRRILTGSNSTKYRPSRRNYELHAN